jgi:hypothetical protein
VLTAYSASFYDLLTDPREHNPMLVPLIHTQGQFHRMLACHELMKKKYPDVANATGIPLTGIENARPETIRIGEVVKRNLEAMPFDIDDYLDYELPEKVDPDWGL